jgi:hypothetical protein
MGRGSRGRLKRRGERRRKGQGEREVKRCRGRKQRDRSREGESRDTTWNPISFSPGLGSQSSAAFHTSNSTPLSLRTGGSRDHFLKGR